MSSSRHSSGRPSLQGFRVLVVDAIAINQLVAQAMLSHAGATVELCNDGEAAVHRLEREGSADAFDVVLIEVDLPGMNGLEATRRIRRNAAHRSLPILSMSGTSLPPERDHCLAAGMNGHVSKPFEPAALLATLHAFGRSPAKQNGRDADRDIVDEPTQPSFVCGDQAPPLDATLGLHHCGGDAALYRKVLGRFLSSHGEVAEELKALLDGARFADATRLAHTIKGLAATVGAQPLSRSAAAIETTLRRGETPPKTGITELAEAMTQLVEAARLAGLVAAEPASAVPTTPHRQAAHEGDAARIDELKRSLEDCEARATELVGTHREALARRLGGSLGDLESAIFNYDFDVALALLGA